MAECKIAKNCPLYCSQTNSQTAAISKWLQSQYCRGNYAMCARHTVHEAMGLEFIPADLFPNELIRAHQIVSQADRFRGGHRKIA